MRSPEVLCKLNRFCFAVKSLARSPWRTQRCMHTHSHGPRIHTECKNTSSLEFLHAENIENIHHYMDWGRSQVTFSVTPGAFTVSSSASSPATGLSPRSVSPSLLILVTSTLQLAHSPDNTTKPPSLPHLLYTFHQQLTNYFCPRCSFTHVKRLIGQKKCNRSM